MDLLYQSNLDGFCIVSSDSDFTRLASRLRESQKYVLGMGESKTPRSFISACNKFLYLDVLWEEAEEHEAGDHEARTMKKPRPNIPVRRLRPKSRKPIIMPAKRRQPVR